MVIGERQIDQEYQSSNPRLELSDHDLLTSFPNSGLPGGRKQNQNMVEI
jgi:hypothetical protein